LYERSYLQNGQQPVPVTFVAAFAVVVNNAKSAAVQPNSLVFMPVFSFGRVHFTLMV